MALNAAIQWNIRLGGSDTSGGGFRAGASGTDFTDQDAPQYNLANGQTQGTAVILLAAAAADMVGNVAYVQGGTGAVVGSWYEVISVIVGTSITVDRSTGLTAGTGATVRIGGALATPGVISGFTANTILVTGQNIKWKYNATLYACTTSTPGPAGPLVLPAAAVTLQGYDLVPGDNTGNRPTYQWTAAAPGVNTFLITLSSATRHHVENIALDGNSVLLVSGITIAGPRDSAFNCVVSNCTGTGTSGFATNGFAGHCQSNNCANGFNAIQGCQYCEAIGTTGQVGFLNTPYANHCIARGMATGYTLTPGSVKNCVADSCTTAGFASASIAAGLFDCLATNCTGSGIGFNVGTNAVTLINCAAYNNNTNVNGTPLSNTGPFASGNTITSLGADPYVNQAGADFHPNNNNPGGAQIRGLGLGVYGQISNVDIGAVQHADPAGGGGAGPVIGCGFIRGLGAVA